MPFVSESQRRKFYATPDLHKYIPEFEAATPHTLPVKAAAPKQHGKRKQHAQRHDNIARLLAQVKT